MHCVNRYNSNDFVVLLRLLEQMIRKYEAKENSDFKDMRELIQNILKNVGENLTEYKDEIEKINQTVIMEKIKPRVTDLRTNILKYQDDFVAYQQILKYLDEYVTKTYKSSLTRIEELIKKDYPVEEQLHKKIKDLVKAYCVQIQKEFDTYEGKVDDLVTNRVDDTIDVDKKNTDKILEEIPNLPPKVVEIRPVLIDKAKCS